MGEVGWGGSTSWAPAGGRGVGGGAGLDVEEECAAWEEAVKQAPGNESVVPRQAAVAYGAVDWCPGWDAGGGAGEVQGVVGGPRWGGGAASLRRLRGEGGAAGCVSSVKRVLSWR